MENLLKEIKNNPVQFALTALSLLMGIISLIIYSATGIIRNFTEEYSLGVFIFLIIGLIANVVILFKRIHLVETIPFVSYIISLLLFFVVNANYLVAVARAIDVTSVSATFIVTIVFLVLASGLGIAHLCIKRK